MNAAPRMLLSTEPIGGLWRITLELAAGLREAGVDVTLALLGAPPRPAQLEAAQAIPGLALVPMRLDPGRDKLELGDALATVARRRHIDAVHLHNPALAASRWHVPVVAAVHGCPSVSWHALHGGDLPADLGWHAAAMARGLVAADAVIAPSHAFAADLLRVYGVRAQVVHHGLRPRPVPLHARARAVLASSCLGDEAADLATLDQAAALLGAPVHVAGHLARPDGGAPASSHLRRLGMLDAGAMRAAFAGHLIFASAARHEPFGLTVLEAAQSGMALVLADIPAFREIWDGAALFATPGDAAGFARACRFLLDDPRAAALAAAAAMRRAAQFNREGMVAATLAFHHALTPGAPWSITRETVRA